MKFQFRPFSLLPEDENLEGGAGGVDLEFDVDGIPDNAQTEDVTKLKSAYKAVKEQAKLAKTQASELEKLKKMVEQYNPEAFQKLKDESEAAAAAQESLSRRLAEQKSQIETQFADQIKTLTDEKVLAQTQLAKTIHNLDVLEHLEAVGLKKDEDPAVRKTRRDSILNLVADQFSYKKGTKEIVDANGTPRFVEDEGRSRAMTPLDLAMEIRDSPIYGAFFEPKQKSSGTGLITQNGQVVGSKSIGSMTTAELQRAALQIM